MLAACAALCFVLVSATPSVAWIVLGYSGILGVLVLGAALIPPVLLIGIGAARKRPGFVISPFLAALVPAVVFVCVGYFQALEVRALEQKEFLKPKSEHAFLVLPFNGCDTYCMQVLIETHFAVVERDLQGGKITVYRRATGDVCYAPAAVESLVTFTKAGYAGLCAIPTSLDALDDALLLETETRRSADARDELPGLYRGVLYSFIERTQGQDRILGRWASGTVECLIDIPIGPRFDKLDFYEAALGFRFSEEPVIGRDDLVERVKKLEPILGQPDLPPAFIWDYGNLLYELRKIQPVEAEPFLERMVVHGNPKVREVGIAQQSKRLTPAPPSAPDAYGRSTTSPTQ